MEPWLPPRLHAPPVILHPPQCPSPHPPPLPQHNGTLWLEDTLSLHCLGPTASSPRSLAEVATQNLLATFRGQELRVCTELPSPASQGQGRPLSPRPTELFCLAEQSVTIGKEHELRHIWILPRHGPSLYRQSSVCGERSLQVMPGAHPSAFVWAYGTYVASSIPVFPLWGWS